MSTVKSPNLFNWATKELSQDAFICWLSEWSNPNLSEKNSYMHSVGKEFVIRLLNTHHLNVSHILSVEVIKQYSNIDIILKIDTDIEKYVLIIEDKMHAVDYNPLENYLKLTHSDQHFAGYRPLGLFIKTGDQASYINVTSKLYSLFLRSDFIEFFKYIEQFKGHNDILNDFKKRLVYNHNRVNSYETLQINKWHWDSWKGFYNYIQNHTKFKDWKYVSNPSGGFLCSNWPWNEMLNFDDDYKVFLQIEKGNLCFKIGEVYGENKDKSEIRNKLHFLIMSRAKLNGLNAIRKPNRFSPGVYMTVAIIERKHWLGEDESVLNKERVIDSLNRYSKFLSECL